MSAWFFVAVAVLANIACNIMLKKLMNNMTAQSPIGSVMEAISSVWFWGGGIAGAVLLLSYLMALRTLDLSASYAIVTSLALIGITLSSIAFLNEQASIPKIAGVILVVIGILLISRTQGS